MFYERNYKIINYDLNDSENRILVYNILNDISNNKNIKTIVMSKFIWDLSYSIICTNSNFNIENMYHTVALNSNTVIFSDIIDKNHLQTLLVRYLKLKTIVND